MATLRDVAKLANTSPTAVSATLNGAAAGKVRVGEATRQRIFEAARQLGYSPNQLAQSLAVRRTGVLGFIFPYSHAFVDRNPFCTQIMSGVFEAAIDTRCNLMLHTALGDDWNAADDGALIDARVDGLLLILPTPHSPVIARCRRERFPCVAICYSPDSEEDFVVNADDFHGGYLAARHLLDLGHRRIGHLSGNPLVATSQPREDGYRAALNEAGIKPEADWIIPGGFNQEEGYAAMQHLLALPARRRPTAIFAANDLSAYAALRALRENGLRVPEDMAIVGFDDTWHATQTDPPLTSVHMPIALMGGYGLRMLLARFRKEKITERQLTLPVSLTIRQSCGASLSRPSPTQETTP
jgi:DNA-binding LacI/PurR family transcriptional regulator